MDSLTFCLDILISYQKPWDWDIFCHLQLDCVHVWVWLGGWGKIGREGERERREKGENEERKEEGRGKEEK